MKSITLERFKKLRPCWLDDPVKSALLDHIGARKERWTALDVLGLPDKEASVEDKLWAVLREELIDAPILHEFACRCAEDALSLVDTPDPRSVAAIAAKRAWLRGEIDDEALVSARSAAWDVARDVAWSVARSAAWYAAWSAAWYAAWSVARNVAWYAAWSVAWDVARNAAWYDAWYDARKKQVEMLCEMLTAGGAD